MIGCKLEYISIVILGTKEVFEARQRFVNLTAGRCCEGSTTRTVSYEQFFD